MPAPPAPLRHRLRLAGSSSEAAVVLVGTVAAAVGLVGFFLVARVLGPDAWVPLVLVLVLTLVSLPIIASTAGRPMDRRLRRILLVAFALKMLCTVPRYAVNEYAYGGSSDASVYHEGGRVLREHVLEDRRWSLEGASVDQFADETRFVGYLTGSLYLVTGASQLAGYLAFAWMCWLGLVLVFRAFRVAYPNAPPYLAAYLVFFLPSTLYWPSSIGKDAVMVLGIGMITLGLARLMAGRAVLASVALLGAGSALVIEIRAHLLLIALAGAAVSLIARNASQAPTRGRLVGRAILLVALVPAMLIGLSRVDELFGSSRDGNSLNLAQALDQAAGRTSMGGSAMETQPVHSPLDLPVATVNVLYRPFLFEARSVPALISALEGTVLLALTVVGARWLWRIGPAMYRNPFAAYCGGFVVAFVVAFTNIGNAGILARQRVQMFPLLMVLVAAAAEHRRLNSLAAAADGSAAEPGQLIPAHPEPRLVLVP